MGPIYSNRLIADIASCLESPKPVDQAVIFPILISFSMSFVERRTLLREACLLNQGEQNGKVDGRTWLKAVTLLYASISLPPILS